MASKPKRSNNLRFNFDLVMAEIARWPVTTLVLMVAWTVITIVVPDYMSTRPDGTQLSAMDKSLLLGGTLLGSLGMKGLSLLMAFPRRHKVPFPGSYLVASFIVFIPIFAFYAAGLNALAGNDFPVPGRILFLLFAYILFSLFFAAFLRLQHATIALTAPFDAYMKRKWNELLGRRGPPTPSE